VKLMSKDPNIRYSALEIIEYFNKPEFDHIRKIVDISKLRK